MLTLDEAKTYIAGGIHEANNTYIYWSGGLSVQDNGVEHLMSTNIAKSLCDAGTKKDTKCYVTLETSFAKILEYANTRVRGRPSSRLNLRGRCDVVLYDRNGWPVGLIEVKRWFGFSRQRDDIDRIEIMLEKCPSIKWGAVAAIRQRWSTDKVDARESLKNFITQASHEFPGCHFRPIHECAKMPTVEIDGADFLGYDAMGALINLRK